MIEDWVDAASGWPLIAIVLVGAALAFGETAFFADFVVPGEVAMVLLGAAVADDELGPVAVAAVAIGGGVGAWLGDVTSFTLGRTVGQAAIRRYRWLERRVNGPLATARDFLDRRGPVAIIGARLVGALRAAVPFAAGTSGWPAARFVRLSACASLVWPAYAVVLGALFGRPAARWIDRAGPWLLVVGLGFVGWAIWRRRRGSGATPAAGACS